MTEYFTYFGTHLLAFFQCLILVIIEIRQMDRRHNFAIRAVSCVSIGIAFCALFAFLDKSITETLSPYLVIIFDIILYLLAIFSLFFLISQNNSTRYFIAAVVFLGKNITKAVSMITISILQLASVFPSTYLQWLIEMLAFVLSAIFIYFIFVRNFKGRTEQVSAKFTFAFVWLFIIVSLLFETSGIIISNKESQFSLFLFIAFLFYIVLMTSFFLNMMKTEESNTMISIIKQMWNEDRKQYQIQKESMDIINIKCHDLRHQIQNYRESSNPNQGVDSMMKQLESSIYIYDAVIKTGNEVLDVILSNISLRCQKKEVQLTCMVDGSSLLFMNEADTYSLFGNMLDNALEYEEKVPDSKSRFISLTVKKIKNFAHIHCENYYLPADAKDTDMKFKSTKKDTVNHGFGLKSMEQIAKKYNSQLDVIIADDMFEVDVMIPLGLENDHDKEK